MADLIETGNEPEYFVTAIRTEPAGGGNTRLYAYNVRHGNELHLLFTAVIPGAPLAVMGSQLREAAVTALDTTPAAVIEFH
jgi:hypothetical protein